MSQQELLKKVVETLDACGIPYMVTGSFASGLYGEPRATHDIDLVTQISSEHVDLLTTQFTSPSYFLQKEAILDAILNHSMFNLLSLDEGDKVDFWMVTDDPFDQSRFTRKVRKMIAGVSLWVSTPEDTILAKLRWCQLSGGSEKQLGDVLRVYEVQRGVLDENYIDHWARHLKVTELWADVKTSANEIDTDNN